MLYDQIETLRDTLNKKTLDYSFTSKEVLETSQELDTLIVEYYKNNFLKESMTA